MQVVSALLALVVAWPGTEALPASESKKPPDFPVNEPDPQVRLLTPVPIDDSTPPAVDATTVAPCRGPRWPEVWGLLGAGGFAYGERMAPNGRPFDPLFALDLDLNVGLLADQRLYLFATSNFWTERPGAHTNPSQGIFDFSKREWDFTTGLAWNVYGPAELRVFGYALNNLNRGVSVTMPSGYADGVGIEGRWYLSIGDRYDVAKRAFLAVGYLPSKVLIDANGNEFPPGLYVQAYLIHDLPAVRSYLFGDVAGITDDDLSLRMLYGDAGLATRPFLVLPALEFRVGATETYDVRVQHNNRVLVYGAVRVVF
jgi:hypothetical protein